MNDATRQFFYRALTLTICVVTAAIVGGQIGAVFFFGDGEGLRIVNALQPEGFGLIGAMCVALGLVKLAETHEAVNSNNNAASNNAASSSPTAPAAAPASSPAPLLADLAGVGAGVFSAGLPSIAADGTVKAPA